jgi:ABC-type nitrate/sulfonate/bicarbonate transport system permease component
MTAREPPGWLAALPGFGKRFGSIIVLFVVWEAIAQFNLVDPFLLPALSDIVRISVTEFGSGDLGPLVFYTLYRTVVGFLIAAVVGVAIGTAMAASGKIRWFCEPIVSFMFPIPKIAFLPIFVLWFGFFDATKIIMAAVACVVTIISATYLGTRGIDKYLLWSARALGTKPHKLFWNVIIPAALPPIITGLQIAFPICLIVSIVAEMATGGQGLGGYMMYHQNLGSSDKMYLGIICAGVIGYTLIEGFSWLRRRLLSWHTESVMTV